MRPHDHPSSSALSVGLLGGGVIGGGWAARFLLNGVDVKLFDPDPEAARKVGEVLANARRAWTPADDARVPPEGTLTIRRLRRRRRPRTWSSSRRARPRRAELKRSLLAAASEAAGGPTSSSASSTSGLLPRELQADMTHPERLVVGHPFNPVYLLPLVEVCGGEQTTPGRRHARRRRLPRRSACSRSSCSKEIDGFVADRLLEALWREALWLVNDGVATAEEIDDAIRFGAGLRWAFMGTFLIYRIAGGEAGMRHFMAQFGPALKWPWTKLMDVPELTDELLDRIVAQSDAQAGGPASASSSALRDDCLVAVLQGPAQRDYAAGAVLKAVRART